ncbi:MAG TPA: P-loop NTPase [Vicinamibacteria bacterium]|jgi:flagellar biosynthesis protein FlhG
MKWLGRRKRALYERATNQRQVPSTSETAQTTPHPLVEELAGWLAQNHRPGAMTCDRSARESGRVIAVGSGKGGVGKTLVSSSLALGLAEHFQRRVVAIDVDLGGANLHTGLGIKRPSFALNRFIVEEAPLWELSEPSGFGGLQFVSGASDIIGLAEFTDADKDRFLLELAKFNEDVIVLDLGAGSSLFNLDLFCTAREGILVTTPEPTAVQNAYGFLRAAIFRRLRLQHRAERNVLDMIDETANHKGNEETDSILGLIRRVSKFDRPAAAQLEDIVGQMRVGLVVNMAKAREAARIADGLARTVRRHLGARLDFLGSVDFDASVRRSICEWRPLVVHFPTARAARRLESVAAKVSSHFTL